VLYISWFDKLIRRQIAFFTWLGCFEDSPVCLTHFSFLGRLVLVLENVELKCGKQNSYKEDY